MSYKLFAVDVSEMDVTGKAEVWAKLAAMAGNAGRDSLPAIHDRIEVIFFEGKNNLLAWDSLANYHNSGFSTRYPLQKPEYELKFVPIDVPSEVVIDGITYVRKS